MGENSKKKRKMMKLASRGKRFGAFCIDAVIPFISLLIFSITSIALGLSAQGPMGNGFGSDPYSPFGYGYGYGYGYGRAGTAGAIVAIIIASIMMILYLIVQIVFYTKSKTLGKAVLGLQVVSGKNGEPIGFWPMLFREWFVKNASATVFCLGFIWILIDDKNRGWHDKILETYVVDLKESARLDARNRRRSRPAVKDNAVEVAETIVKTTQEATAKVMQDAQPGPSLTGPVAEETAKPVTNEMAADEPETEITVAPEEPEVNEPEINEPDVYETEDTVTEEIKRTVTDEQE